MDNQDIKDLHAKIDDMKDAILNKMDGMNTRLSEGAVKFENHSIRIDTLEEKSKGVAGKVWSVVMAVIAATIGSVLTFIAGNHK